MTRNARSSWGPQLTQKLRLLTWDQKIWISTTEVQQATENPTSLSLSLYFQLLAVIQIIKTNHTKLDPTRSFFPQSTSWVLGMGLEWEAGVANATERK